MWCALRRLVEQAGQAVDDWVIGGAFQEAIRAVGGGREVAAARVAMGAQLEEYAAETCARIWPADRADAPDDGVARRSACQLYFDGYCAAVWTSAHAEYIAALDAGVKEPPAPSILTVPCAASGLDLSDLYARRVAPKGDVAYPKAAEPLVQLLARCTNPGARGWDSVLKDALEHHGSRSVVVHATHVALLGLHPQLHPSLRPSWMQRVRILRVVATPAIQGVAQSGGGPHMKEVMRRCLASIMAASPAMHAALSNAGHPVRHLLQPPMQFPHVGMEAAMTAFADAGAHLATAAGAELSQTLLTAFTARNPSRLSDAQLTVTVAGPAWESGWLGTLQCF